MFEVLAEQEPTLLAVVVPICCDLNAYETASFESEPDFDRRLRGFASFSGDEVHSQLTTQQLMPIVHSMLFLLRATDLSMRASAAAALELVAHDLVARMPAATDDVKTDADSGVKRTPATAKRAKMAPAAAADADGMAGVGGYTKIVVNAVLPAIRKAAGFRKEQSRNESLSLLGVYARIFQVCGRLVTHAHTHACGPLGRTQRPHPRTGTYPLHPQARLMQTNTT